MAFCGKCGAKVEDDVKFCQACGAPIQVQNTNEKNESNNNNHQNISEENNNIEETLKKLNNTKDTTSQFEQNDIKENMAMSILSYISILVLVPIFAVPKSKFVRFHANQGLVLLICEVIYSVLYGVLSGILYGIAWGLGRAVMPIVGLIGLILLILSIIGIVNVINGRAKELPIIGRFRILK